MLCTCKRNRVIHQSLSFSGEIIKEVTSHKHLVLNLTSSCDWLIHIDYIKEKSLNRLNLLRSLKFTLNRQSLQKNYFTFIRPILEYADVVWDNCTQQQQNELEKNQLEAGRTVTGTTKLINIQKLYDELGWDKLSDRRRLHKLLFSCPLGSWVSLWNFETIRGSLMKPKWQKLASLAQEICTL